jgi:hypothetical protein
VATATPDIPSASHTTSPTSASSPVPDKTTSPTKDDPPPEQDNSAPDVHMDLGAQQDPSASDVHMDTGAQPDAPDTGAPTRSTGTTKDASTGNKSAGINKGKAPEVPEIQTDLALASAGQAAPAMPEQPASTTLAPGKTPAPTKAAALAQTSIPTKSGTLKIKQIIKSGTQSAATTSAKHVPSSSALALHFCKAAA